MPTTPILGLPYPGLTDPPNGPAQIQALAVASDALKTNATQTLLFTSSSNLDTSNSGTATWLTLGNVTVPTWATKCHVTYSINGFYTTSVGNNTTAVIKIGATAGAVSRRIIDAGATSARSNMAVCDEVVGLTPGVASVTVSASWLSGTVSSERFDATSTATATFTFQP